MRTDLYILSSAAVSPQESFELKDRYENIREYQGTKLTCIEPDYKNILDPKLIRRMSRVIRMGAATALQCMKSANRLEVDGIITGTAYGCLEDTITFLNRMVGNKEEMLTPTAFIQSTHNTIAAQIALLLKCNAYNNTFVQKSFSFEAALTDAVLLSREMENCVILTGAVDELTETSHAIISRFNKYRENVVSSKMCESPAAGTMAGEGAAFFLLSNQNHSGAIARLDGMSMLYDPGKIEDRKYWLNTFLDENDSRREDIGLILVGRNGDSSHDQLYPELESVFSPLANCFTYKNFCGEYPTSTSFAMWMATETIRTGTLPLYNQPFNLQDEKKKILLLSSDIHGHNSAFLLSSC